MNKKAQLILHPVRMRIVQTLLGNRKLTVHEIAERLPNVPQATLYRNLNKLVAGNILEVVDSRQVRGAVEKIYALGDSKANFTTEEFDGSTKEEQMNWFIQFATGLIDQYGRYLEQDQIDLAKDGLTFREADLYMSDEEFEAFKLDILAAYGKVMPNEPAPHRSKRTVSFIIIPEGDNTGNSGRQ
ncbi:helix-turn-helix domain-containing protein [Paenibacillus profundus]|uniref:Helix-turn-helix domain-containing protein n=1 Tax=Paenibacillus profundus TaxID=1173085 RepID=A0ABS8YE55_9BACL|nr:MULTISPECIES: helix-turn-helix domain-containing protein [Paenibacillus]MCE5170283.1 helix-turn-helix domain-containing protein [Paenibacillus profundus]MCM3340744.1 helix-turn-helix domain-containing protein [Paenibacillus sp. MER TA 81-3]